MLSPGGKEAFYGSPLIKKKKKKKTPKLFEIEKEIVREVARDDKH